MHDVCVVGLGAIGAIYALALERSGNARVTAVCRSNYQLVSENGLDIDSTKLGRQNGWKPWRVLRSTEDAADRTYTFVVCCFKALPDVQSTPALLAPILHKTSTFVLLQNGIGIDDDLRRAVPDATIISGCAWIDATAVDGGRRVLHNSFEKLTLGVHDRASTHTIDDGGAAGSHEGFHMVDDDALRLLVDLLRSGGTNPVPTENMLAERWRKVLWNASYSTLCTITRASVPDLLSSKVAKQTMPAIRGLMDEVLAVARAAGIHEELLPGAAIEEIISMTNEEYAENTENNRVPPAYKPSMLVDLEHGRPMEVEVIIGSIVHKGIQLGVPTPKLEVVYASLRVIQNGLVRRLQ